MPTIGSNEFRNTKIYYDSEPEIDLFASKEMIIYPNPSTGIFSYSSSCFNNEKFKITVYNTLGQKVFEKLNLNVDDNKIDVSNLGKGTYFINFIDVSNRVTKTLILK